MVYGYRKDRQDSEPQVGQLVPLFVVLPQVNHGCRIRDRNALQLLYHSTQHSILPIYCRSSYIALYALLCA